MRLNHLLLLPLFFCSFTVNAQIYQWVDENGKKHFSDKPRELPTHRSATISQDSRSDRSSAKSTIYTAPTQPLITPKVRDLLIQRDFDKLESFLNQLNKTVEKDITKEYQLVAAYNAFASTSSNELSRLNEWVNFHPKAHYAYLARAHHFSALGWKARGGKWASETSQEQFESMQSYFNLAAKDIEKALEIKPDTSLAYLLLIKMASALGEDRSKDAFMRKALIISPASYEIRRMYLWHTTPRWGGNYALMEQYALDALEQAANNPKLQQLRGYIYFDKARIERGTKAYSVAEKLCTQGLSFGDNPELLFERAKSRYNRDNFSAALSDLDLAISLNPEISDYYHWRAYTHREMGQLSIAADDALIAIKLEPESTKSQKLIKSIANTYENKGYEAGIKHQHENALTYYKQALLLTPENSVLYYRKAHTLIKLNRFDDALVSIKNAIKYNPQYFEAYLLIDYLLAKKRDWNTIIAYWDQYIRLDPINGRAYTERGGAYFHKGDIKQAVENARIGAELGNAEGKEAYEKYRHRVK